MSTSHHDQPFYGKCVDRKAEQEYIQKLLRKYQNEPFSDELKKKVWDDLALEKHLGNITIPFNPTGKFPNLIQVVLDSKV
jgi:hypothetical protein